MKFHNPTKQSKRFAKMHPFLLAKQNNQELFIEPLILFRDGDSPRIKPRFKFALSRNVALAVNNVFRKTELSKHLGKQPLE